jgi:site-specific DNA-methyltransferase (adenine-specific)
MVELVGDYGSFIIQEGFENAAIGVFVTLEPATSAMHKEAASAGFYHSPGWNQDYPKLQIVTIDQLMAGGKVQMPPAFGTFKQAQKASQVEGKQPGLDLDV